MPPTFLSPHIYDTTINKHFVQISDGPHQSTGKSRTRFHVFMITGNPGCIGYYHDFLSLLWDDLNETRSTMSISVYGTSMSGFTTDDDSPVLGLQEQIEFLETRLGRYIDQYHVEETNSEHKVIIVGHSVGAYIGLELVRRHQKSSSSRGSDIVGYVGLWPTVTYIGQSKRGRRVGWLLKLPFFALLVGLAAKVILRILGPVLVTLILKFMSFPEKAAQVTVDFLSSRIGIYQALYMAGDEMREINADRWNEDIWGALSQPLSKPRRKLFLCFGEDDHWVADHRRDELIKTRGRCPDRPWLPEMIIDDTGIPHSFCINHSKPVAKRTAAWITGIINDSPSN